MIIGVPKQIKNNENRVALTPGGTETLVKNDHQVLIQKDAGLASGFTNQSYRDTGGRIVETINEIYESAELVIKVKEPQPEEYPLLREEQILFTFLHLAAATELTQVLLNKKVTAIAYETVQLDDGSLPLLAPMSQIAGRLAV